MRAAWPFVPLLTVCRDLCLVMGPMNRITAAWLYICHVFLSGRLLAKLLTKQKIVLGAEPHASKLLLCVTDFQPGAVGVSVGGKNAAIVSCV